MEDDEALEVEELDCAAFPDEGRGVHEGAGDVSGFQRVWDVEVRLFHFDVQRDCPVVSGCGERLCVRNYFLEDSHYVILDDGVTKGGGLGKRSCWRQCHHVYGQIGLLQVSWGLGVTVLGGYHAREAQLEGHQSIHLDDVEPKPSAHLTVKGRYASQIAWVAVVGHPQC